MENTDFQAFPKIPRLNRDMVLTEKIDGTNSAINFTSTGDGDWHMTVQSRNRIITPENDNYGFARWAYEHMNELYAALGDGIHYGEWWGGGIQRGYGLGKNDKRFSLFNVKRWEGVPFVEYGLDNVASVPVLYMGPFSTVEVTRHVNLLNYLGSHAVKGWKFPEGVIVWHEAAQQLFKVTCKDDEKPKGSGERG